MNRFEEYSQYFNSESKFFDDFREEFLSELTTISRSISIIEETIGTKLKETIIEIASLAKKHDIDSYQAENLSDYGYYKDYSKDTIFKSTFLISYSFFENRFVEICNRSRSTLNLNLKLKDLYGQSDIEKCYLFLKKVAEIDLSIVNREWSRIQDFRKIRNCIVHHYSNIVTEQSKRIDEQKLYGTVAKFKNLNLNDSGLFLIKDENFIQEFLSELYKFIFPILDEVESKIAKETGTNN